MTLELMGMNGGVRSVLLALPPLPPLPSDGAAEEIDTAAGGDVPHGAIGQPHTNVFVARSTEDDEEQLRRDKLSDANHWNQQESREVSTDESDAEINQRGATRPRWAKKFAIRLPANSRLSDKQGNKGAVVPGVNVQGHRPQGSIGAAGGGCMAEQVATPR